MSGIAPCVPCCSSTPQTVNVPGGSGQSAVTATTSSFVIPAFTLGATVPVNVGDTTWMKTGKNLFVSDGANVVNFVVASVNSATQFTGRALGFKGDTAAGTTVQSGALVMSGGGDMTVPSDLDALTAFTDNSGGTKNDTIASTVARSTVTIGPFAASSFANAQLYGMAIPFNFTILSVLFRCTIAAITTGAKAATFTTRIGANDMTSPVNTTGGVISAAGPYTLGSIQAGTGISGNNTGTAGQTIQSLVSGVTAFTEGSAQLEFTIRNDDLNATIAAIADKLNTLRTNLRHI